MVRSVASPKSASNPAWRAAAAGSLINTGQDCTAAARAYVQRPLDDAFRSRRRCSR